MSNLSTSTVVYATVGTVATGALAYAVYFDYKRRHDVEFRKSLKKEAKRQAKAAKVEQEQQGKRRRQEVRELVDESNEDGYPVGAEDKEAYFMTQVSEGEQLVQDSTWTISCVRSEYRLMCKTATKELEAALCFFKALKVYPQPKELMNIYDKTVPKVCRVLVEADERATTNGLQPVLDLLAEMVAYDRTSDASEAGSSAAGVE